jgi:hypothetical protein
VAENCCPLREISTATEAGECLGEAHSADVALMKRAVTSLSVSPKRHLASEKTCKPFAAKVTIVPPREGPEAGNNVNECSPNWKAGAKDCSGLEKKKDKYDERYVPWLRRETSTHPVVK